MKKMALLKYIAALPLLFQLETALGDTSSPHSTLLPKDLPASSAEVYKKVLKDLTQKTPQITKDSVQRLGPGVTGGGDSCEQKIAYSYAFLISLIENNKIGANVYNQPKDELLPLLKQTTFAFDRGLTKGRPVEALNVPPMNAILLDRALCDNNYEPLSFYTPLLMHETLRLAGRQDDENYAISKKYVGLIRQESELMLNNTRSFRVMSETASGTVALAWGLRGQPLDFESFDKIPYEEQTNFFLNNFDDIENYLVDLKRMKIISIVGVNEDCSKSKNPDCEIYEGAYAEFSSGLALNRRNFTWHFDNESRIGLRVLYNRWSVTLDKIYALSSNQEVVGVCTENCQSLIEDAAAKSLTPDQKARIAKYSSVTYRYQLVPGDRGANWQVSIKAEIPKSTDPSYNLKAALKIEFENGKFKMTTGKFVPVK